MLFLTALPNRMSEVVFASLSNVRCNYLRPMVDVAERKGLDD
jgi:hypothetical protein